MGSLVAQPGWVHFVTMTDYGSEGTTLPNGERLQGKIRNEAYYQIDKNKMVTGFITIQQDEHGQPIQVSTFWDGVLRNLTFGFEDPQLPYPPDFSYGLLTFPTGTPLTREGITWDGEPALRYTLLENDIRHEYIISPTSGQILYLENVSSPRDAAEEILNQEMLVTVERVDSPPEDALAYLEQEASDYRPLPPQGVPAPPGFDPAGHPLKIVTVFADDPDQPSRFYGDIYAGDYLIGRVDFGGTPTGWCERSPNGWRIAFNYSKNIGDDFYEDELRWYSLVDRKIHIPLPGMRLTSEITWAPDSARLAFGGCMENLISQHCALYVYNTDTGELIDLGEVPATPWMPRWSPDGQYVASLVPSEDMQDIQLYVVDAENGSIFYQGDFDPLRWQAPPDSPTHEWHISFPRTMSSGDGCR